MDRRQLRPEPEYFEQLALSLNLEEGETAESGFVSPEEARRRSEAARVALDLTGKKAAWFEQYLMLLDNGWPWRVACYIAWAASPKRSRWPKTQAELATEVLGLTSDRQIGTWRKKNRAIDEVIAVLQAAPLMEHRADVLQALAEAASDPDHRNNPDRKLFLEITGDYVPRAKVDVNRMTDVDDLADYDEAELKRMAQQIEKQLGAGNGED
jgi:hypothetical protein